MKISKYTYPAITRCSTDVGRYYDVGSTRALPSVTTILSHTSDHEHLDKWKEKVGAESATKIVNEAALIGTHLHSNLENYCRGSEIRTGPLISKLQCNIIIQKGLSFVSEVWGIESPLYFPHLYAGTADMIAVYKDKPSILDFKNSIRIKKREWLDDYFCQLTAYAAAHNQLYNTDISNCVIMMVSRDCNYKEFILEGDEFKKYTDMWFSRVELFYQTYGI